MLALGLASFAGCLGLGALALRLCGVRWPAPFLQVGAVLLGLQLESLAVQALAMAQVATRGALIGVWLLMVVLGAAGLVTIWRVRHRGTLPPVPIAAVGLLAAAAAINLAAAVVPSSKIDELYYAMLLTSRLVADHGLLAYRLPMEAALLAQMSYAIGAAPLHALGFPDAPNVVSWLLAMMLVWFGWRLLREQGVKSAFAYCIVAALPIGSYPLIFQTTGSSHSFGDLALAVAVVALAWRERLMLSCGPTSYALLMSILSWSAASAKLSLIPVSAALLVLAGALAWRATAGPRFRLIAALASAWLLFGAPMLLWEWLNTGSPFGPFLADLFGAGFYQPGAFSVFADAARFSGREPLSTVLFENGAAYAALIWLAAMAFFLWSGWPVATRWIMGGLLAGQGLLLIWLLPYHLRFLSGLPYGLAICCALALPAWVEARRRLVSWALALAVLPWLAGQLVYGAQFVPRALGLEDRTAFLRRNIALFDDFATLDARLPRDAVLFAPDLRLPSVYAPRAVFFDAVDLPADRPAYLMSVSQLDMDDEFVGGPEIHANPRARMLVFRRWWVPTVETELHVYPVRRSTSLR